MFEIEITVFQPEPGVSRSAASTAGEAEAAVRTGAREPCVVTVAHRDGRVSHGELHLWLASGRALVRLDEHRQWHAAEPEPAAAAAAADVEFRDTDGTAFSASFGETIPRSQAFDVLAFWLRTGGMMPRLTWNRARVR